MTGATGRLDGKVILITGAAAGIGRATALRLSGEGARLIVADRNAEGVEALAASIRSSGADAAALTFDAADFAAARAMVSRAVEVHGSLDCLINNAGIYRRGHFLDTDPAEWSQVFAVNLESLFHVIQQALPALIASRGNVVNTASTAGVEGIAYAAAYAAAKAGVIALTKSLAAEYAPKGVRFNAVAPGRVRTDLSMGVPQVENTDPAVLVRPPKLSGRTIAGEPEDVAAAFAYLASDDAAYVSGSVLVVDGAQMAG